MCNFLTRIIMPSFLSHFPIFYAFFSTKTGTLIKISKSTLNLTFYADF
jgi:hypothetical protein